VIVRHFKEHNPVEWAGLHQAAQVYFLAFRNDPALHERFVDWGYVAETVAARGSR